VNVKRWRSETEAAFSEYPSLLARFLSDQEFVPLLRSSKRAKHRAAWRTFVQQMRLVPPNSKELTAQFHDRWHVCHHFFRELIEDEENVLEMLWVWLPRYGGPERTLYRGENLRRYESGRLGIAWTESIDTAKMFGSGLNAVCGGGLLLRAQVPASAIIAGPSAHATWLGENEFTVDPRKLAGVEIAERFPHFS
jgi:hypothetical protein